MNLSRNILIRSYLRTLYYSQQKCVSSNTKPPDIIGPADPVSNLHPIKYGIPPDETLLGQKLRKHREELQEWNEIFWTKHNLNFIQSKKNFEKTELSKKVEKNLTADEISVFYKKFLDDNWNTHSRYLLSWYRKTIYVNFLHFLVLIERLCKSKKTIKQ